MKKAAIITVPITAIAGILILLPFLYIAGATIIDALESMRYANLEQRISSIARTINLSISQQTSHVETIKGTKESIMFQFFGPDASFSDFRQLYRENRLIDLVDCRQEYCLCIATLNKRDENFPITGNNWEAAKSNEYNENFIFYSESDAPNDFLQGIYADFFNDFEDIRKIKCEVIQKPIVVYDGIFVYMYQNATYSKILSFSFLKDDGAVFMEVVS